MGDRDAEEVGGEDNSREGSNITTQGGVTNKLLCIRALGLEGRKWFLVLPRERLEKSDLFFAGDQERLWGQYASHSSDTRREGHKHPIRALFNKQGLAFRS